MTPEDFFVSVSSHGKVTLNCRVSHCYWYEWWDIFPSMWFLREQARDHLLREHDS